MSELKNELNEKEIIQDNPLSEDSLEGNESAKTTANNEPSAANDSIIDSADEKMDSNTDFEDVSDSANTELQDTQITDTGAEVAADPETANTEATEMGAETETVEAAETETVETTETGTVETAEAEPTEESAENAEPTEEEKKAKRKKILKICGGVAAALVAVYCLIAFTYQSKFTTGTIINGIDASGMTLDEYTEALTEKVESYVLTMKFRDKKTEKIKGTDVGYTYVADDGAQKLLENQNIFGWARGYFGVTKEYTVNEGCKFDEDKMKELATSLPELQFENMEVPTNAHLGVDENASEGGELAFEIVPETYGTQLVPDTFAEGVIEAAKSGVQEYDVDKEDLYVKPTIYSDDQYLKDSIGGFNEFLSTSVTYDLPNGEQEVLDASVLKNWIAMREDGVQYLNEEIVKDHVNAYVALLAMKVDDVHTTRVLHSTLQAMSPSRVRPGDI